MQANSCKLILIQKQKIDRYPIAAEPQIATELLEALTKAPLRCTAFVMHSLVKREINIESG